MKRSQVCGILLFMLLVLLGRPVEAAVSISDNSITIQKGETHQLKVLNDGNETVASAWGSSDISVASVDASGIVTGNAKGSAVITAMVNGSSVECLVSVVESATPVTVRYSVLVLDASNSVKGKPLKREKEAAKHFCSRILNASGDNYLAVVSFNSSANVLSGFTNDLSTLNRSIDRATVKKGTNINEAFKKASMLLAGAPSGSGVIRNVVLCSDGLPQTGAKSASGRYRSKDHKYYRYANAVYKTDVKLKRKGYFIYALGFFNNSKGNNLKFGKKLMKDLASKDKYYVVRNTKDIDRALKNIAKTITSVVVNKKSATLLVGETFTVRALVNGASTKASWKSSNPSIASVNASGKVTARKKGTVRITGKVKGKSVTCKVTVKKKKASASNKNKNKKKKNTASKSSIRLNRSSLTIYVGESVKLNAVVKGKKGKVTWKSSKKSVVKVSKKGKIKGRKEGKAIITAKANGVKATCTVTVKIKHPEYSQYFMVKKQKSYYGSELINEYGIRLVTNEDAVIRKCAVYIKRNGSQVERTIACVGKGITYAKGVPYLARDGKIKYDGLVHFNVYNLTPDSNGIWSNKGSFSMVHANLEDANGNELAVRSTGVSEKNTKVFYDLDKMIAWLKK